MGAPLKHTDASMKERNALASKLSVPFHSHFWQAELFSIRNEKICFNSTQVSVIWFGWKAFTEPENVEHFMILQWINRFGISATTWTTSEEEWEEKIWSWMHPHFSAPYHC